MSWFRTTTWLDIFLLISPSLLILKTNPRDSKTRSRNKRSDENACKFVTKSEVRRDYQKDGSHICVNAVYSLKTVPQFLRPGHPCLQGVCVSAQAPAAPRQAALSPEAFPWPRRLFCRLRESSLQEFTSTETQEAFYLSGSAASPFQPDKRQPENTRPLSRWRPNGREEPPPAEDPWGRLLA